MNHAATFMLQIKRGRLNHLSWPLLYSDLNYLMHHAFIDSIS